MASGRETDDLLRAVLELQKGIRVEANSRRIFELYYPWVCRFFGRLGYAPQDSEDLAQETFSHIFERIGSFRHEGSFKSWLFAVASNLNRNEYRRRHQEKRRRPEVSIDTAAEPDGALPELASPGAAPDQTAYATERREALSRAMAGLPPQMRQVLSLRVDQDLKYREIAIVLQISIETVKAHLFQARQRLRDELGEDYGEWGD
ncbi:MAG TPA: RNA polymerase sigma factor [Thermoanaerobaculia bacterium]|jgi:RNA polymerase sigma-70 factor (ECF subfamily)